MICWHIILACVLNILSIKSVSAMTDYPSVIAHGSIMAFAWIFFASNAVILARYYRRLLPTKHICGYPVWFPFHFIFALSLGACSLAAFLVIIAEKDWLWVSSFSHINFAHSILGAIGAGFAGLQFIYSMCRPSLGSSARDLFNGVHTLIGFVAFIFSTTAILVALFIPRVGYGQYGWSATGVMMGWLFWCFVVFSLLEILKYFDSKHLLNVPFPDTYPNEVHNRFDKVRLVILVLQIAISGGCGIAMVVLIALSNPTKSRN